MDWLLLLARVVLGAVFLLAAVSKLADRQGSRHAVGDFGVPNWLRTPIALLLPFVELAVGVLLLSGAFTRLGVFAALALLILFTTAIAISLARGKTPDCHCFGQLHSAPVGSSTLIRNALLTALAAFLYWRCGETADIATLIAAVRFTTGTWIALGIASVSVTIAAGEAWLLWNGLRQHGR